METRLMDEPAPTMSSSHIALAQTDEDDDSEREGQPERPDLHWDDDSLQKQLLRSLNQMRKNKSFCDVVLQVEQHDLHVHRVVMAAVSPYFMELFTSSPVSRKEVEGHSGILYNLNGGFGKRVLEILVDYAYTARLDIPADLVKSVYAAAVRLRMDGAARECARYLASFLDVQTCLELRGMLGFAPVCELARKVDDFIAANMVRLQTSRKLRALPCIRVEMLHNSREEMEAAHASALCQLTLDWVHACWLEDEELTLEKLAAKTHMLYMGKDNALQDCESIEEGSPIDSEIIKDYKDVSKQQQAGRTHKVQRHSAVKPAKPRELLFTRHINQEEEKTEDKSEDWKMISNLNLDEKSIVAIVTVDGHLTTLSVMQRLNQSSSPNGSITNLWLASLTNGPRCKSKSPSVSRPPSTEKDLFAPLPTMSQAKSAVGVGCVGGNLIVCGGFDRVKCMKAVEMYNLSTNSWSLMEPMQKRRGRFAITVNDTNDVIYAVAGSNGQADQNTAEKCDPKTGKWEFIANLPAAVTNIGLCSLDGAIYCIGGTQGQSGSKQCYRLTEDETKWERISSLHVGRSQAAVAAFQGKIWVVGGCDAWNPLASVEIYDPASNMWKMGPPMSSPRRGCALVASEGLLYVFGGSDGTHSLCTSEVFDPRMNLWTAGPNMTTRRVNVAGALVAGKIWAVGGFSGKSFLNTMEYLDPERDEWTTFITLRPSDGVAQASDDLAPLEGEAAAEQQVFADSNGVEHHQEQKEAGEVGTE